MISHKAISFLVYALPVLVVAVAVLMGGCALTHAAGDAAAAQVLWWIAIGSVMLLVGDVVLLLGALGLNHLSQSDGRHDDVSG